MLGLGSLGKKLFGTQNDRALKSVQPLVQNINALEPEFQALSDEALAAKTAEFRERLDKGESLDDLLPEAFACAREASVRTLGLRPFDVQLVGAIFLHQGNISEMKTGEGKTLTAVLAVYLNALTGRGVHVVTVNDYLAKRDAEWMGKIYEFLGITVGFIVPGMEFADKKAAYEADVIYATNNELGFDYLRDNIRDTLDKMVQRDHYYAIVDEVDSILIDEARTPLIISGPSEDRSDLYNSIDALTPEIEEEHYELDEKNKNAHLTDEGIEAIEAKLQEVGLLEEGATLFDPESTSIVHHVNMALAAHKAYNRDTDYIVRNGEVILIDTFTGRMMPGRRLSNGLHQAIEAKEQVAIQPENVTFAQVTYQNYFRLYDKLAGMTGTALTEAEEFGDIYGLGVLEIPTNVAVTRVDEDDRVYSSTNEKYTAVIEEIKTTHAKGQPLLIGTTSIEKSELLSDLLKKAGIKHNVLNARFHEKEAEIIAEAGVPGAVTIATNMAGRGTDIQLGGNVEMKVQNTLAEGDHPDPVKLREEIEAAVAADKEKAIAAGGLCVIGTERHESRRIDNQLRGRSGRQGDPGRTIFFLSFQDDLMRIFGSERIDSMLKRLGMKEGEAIIHPWVNKSLERAQGKVEGFNFDVRKQLLKYDDVMNDQRKVIFGQRLDIMKSEDQSETVREMRHDVIDDLVTQHVPEKAYPDQWDTEGLSEEVKQVFGIELPIVDWAGEEGVDEEVLIERLEEETDKAAAQKVASHGAQVIRRIEKQVLLQAIDKAWREHLLRLEHLRAVVGFRGYAQRDPLNEYKTEAFTLFESLLTRLRQDVTQQLSHVQIMTQEQQEQLLAQMRAAQEAQAKAKAEAELASTAQGGDEKAAGSRASAKGVDPDDPSTWSKAGRNDPCPCGSGKKFKHCHGRA